MESGGLYGRRIFMSGNMLKIKVFQGKSELKKRRKDLRFSGFETRKILDKDSGNIYK